MAIGLEIRQLKRLVAPPAVARLGEYEAFTIEGGTGRGSSRLYQPDLFKEERIEIMHALMRAHPFATLVTVGGEESGPEANHLPLVLHAGENDGDGQGLLRGHVARGNPLWQELDRRVDALAIFHGPQHYITPSWYPSKAEHGKVVPTWNYAVVHAYGRLSFFDEPARLLEHVGALTAQQEAGFDQPWSLADAPAEFLEQMVKGIVGFELTISRLEGKSKMSQNRAPADRVGVVDGLTSVGTPTARAVADLTGH